MTRAVIWSEILKSEKQYGQTTISLNGKSQITSELKTKNGSSPEVRLSFAKAKGPAVPSASVSWENESVILSYMQFETNYWKRRNQKENDSKETEPNIRISCSSLFHFPFAQLYRIRPKPTWVTLAFN